MQYNHLNQHYRFLNTVQDDKSYDEGQLQNQQQTVILLFQLPPRWEHLYFQGMQKHQQKLQKTEDLKEKTIQKELDDCSFKPKLNKNININGDFKKRQCLWLQQKKQNQKLIQQQMQNQNLENCSFKPEFISKQLKNDFDQDKYLSRGAANHMVRQDIARKMKEQPVIKKPTQSVHQRITVPQEFNISKTVKFNNPKIQVIKNQSSLSKSQHLKQGQDLSESEYKEAQMLIRQQLRNLILS